MGILLRLLIGNRQVIQQIAGNRIWLAVAIVAALLAELARTYNTLDFSVDRPIIGVHIGASLLYTYVLYWFTALMVSRGPNAHPSRPDGAIEAEPKPKPLHPWGDLYARFLCLYWLAGLPALLQAVPYERFLDIQTASDARASTQAAVGLLQTVLTVRILSVLTNVSWKVVLWPVLTVGAFAATIDVLAFAIEQLPRVYGGIGMQRTQGTIASIRGLFNGAAVVSALPLLLASVVIRPGAGQPSTAGTDADTTPFNPARAAPVPWSAWALCLFAAVALGLLVPVAQREQRARSFIRQVFTDAALTDAEKIAKLKDADWEHTPPHWNPAADLARWLIGPSDALIALEREAIAQTLPPPLQAFTIQLSWAAFRPKEYGIDVLPADRGTGLQLTLGPARNWEPTPERITTLLLHSRHNPLLSPENCRVLQAAADREEAARQSPR